MSVFKDAGHLFRFAGLFVLAFLIFLVVRHYVVPKSFGQYGHYRGASIGEIAHADDPGTVKPVLPDTATLCARCHTASAAKPKGFPQVDPASHSQGLSCETCHQPHSPGMDAPKTDAPKTAAGGVK